MKIISSVGIRMISLLVVILSHSIFSLIVFSVHTLVSLLRTGAISCRQRYKFSFELPNVIATIFLLFSAYSCRKVSKDDKFATKSNNFWDFMLDIVEKVLTLQRIWEDKRFLADKTVKDHRAGRWEIIGLERSIPSFP